MRNPITVLLLLLASTAALAAPTFLVEQDTGQGTYQTTVENSIDAAVMAPEMLITASHLVLVPFLDNQAVLVPTGLADCNSARAGKVFSVQEQPMVRDFKPHGHWLC